MPAASGRSLGSIASPRDRCPRIVASIANARRGALPVWPAGAIIRAMDDPREATAPSCCTEGDGIARHFDTNVSALESKGQAESLAPVSTKLLAHLRSAGP